MSDVAKTPKEELECEKKYLYEYSMFWECNDGSKCQILEEDVCDLLNELNKDFEDCEKLLDSKDDFIHKFKRDIEELEISIKLFEDDIATKDKKIDEQQDLIEELYDFRLTYNALLFNEWAENQKYEVYKSRRHGNGELCFDGEYFIVVAQLPTGQVTNHYHIRHWDMFKVNEYEKVKEEFDGHTPSDVIERLQQVIDV